MIGWAVLALALLVAACDAGAASAPEPPAPEVSPRTDSPARADTPARFTAPRLEDAASGAESPRAAAPPALAPDVAVAESAHELLDDASARGRWDADDADELRAIWRTLDQTQREAILSRLIPALNDGSLVLEPGVAPL
jgi:hypothetical protein